MVQNDTNNQASKLNINRISKNTGMSIQNVYLTYTHNKKKDKTKMLNVLSLGSVCAEQNLTLEDLEKALTLYKAIKNA